MQRCRQAARRYWRRLASPATNRGLPWRCPPSVFWSHAPPARQPPTTSGPKEPGLLPIGRPSTSCACSCSDESVDEVLEIFLAARQRLRIDVRRDRGIGDGLQRRALGVDLLAG